jgi:hypothetical protein
MTLKPQAHAPHGCIDWRVRGIPRPERMDVLMQDINLVLVTRLTAGAHDVHFYTYHDQQSEGFEYKIGGR